MNGEREMAGTGKAGTVRPPPEPREMCPGVGRNRQGRTCKTTAGTERESPDVGRNRPGRDCKTTAGTGSTK